MNHRLYFPLLLLPALLPAATHLFVSPTGNDAHPGTLAKPLKTLAQAQQAARHNNGPVTIHLRAGIYYLPSPLILTPADSGTTWQAYPNETPVLSGGRRLRLQWKPYRDGIFQAQVPPGLESDQLFVNGERQHMARYPNFDPAIRHFNGYAPDAISPARAARWHNPRGGFIHAMHRHEWGDFHYLITGKDATGNLLYEGGWQNNRRMGMHDKYRMVENIFEELDAPGEWFLNSSTHTLYFYPPNGLNLKTATVEAVRLRSLIELRGSSAQPVRRVTLRGLTLRHTARTFMDNREPLLRSDWTIYRGAALFLEGAEDATIEDCLLDQPGGNAIFVNNYNRRVTIRSCEIARAGANAIAFVGDPGAVRNPLFEYAQRQSLKDIDRTPGPKTPNYPAQSLVEDCLIYQSGRVEKQTAGVHIAMAQDITVRHSSIYELPRAGINIGDGCWGGHVIEFCDVFDTVLETGDHGSFNSWGRDRYWFLNDVDMNAISTTPALRDLPLLDAVKPTILRNNRWRCDHGWDIDLDDGSSNYEILNNLCLNGGLKNREGFARTVENNVIVSNSFHPHVWFHSSEDTFRRNIVFLPYKPIRVERPWGRDVDANLLHTPGATPSPATILQSQSGRDAHSQAADALFINPSAGDYRVQPNSPALALGFENFPMDQFGVTSPRLKAKAKTPVLPAPNTTSATLTSTRDPRIITWRGAQVRNILGLGELSAAGLPGETGVLVLSPAPPLQPNDVIVQVGNSPIASINDLPQANGPITVIRNQQRIQFP